MVQDRLRDGTRIAQLLASELTGNRGALESVLVVDANRDVEPTADGALAYRVAVVSTPEAITIDDRGQTTLDETVEVDLQSIASIFVQPERARVEFTTAPDTAAETARAVELRTRPKAVEPPRTLVFLEDGAAAKQVLPVFEAIVAALDGDDNVDSTDSTE